MKLKKVPAPMISSDGTSYWLTTPKRSLNIGDEFEAMGTRYRVASGAKASTQRDRPADAEYDVTLIAHGNAITAALKKKHSAAAERAFRCVLNGDYETGPGLREGIGDLLCDLMHLADEYGLDFTDMTRLGAMHHDAEIDGDDIAVSELG